MTIIYLVRHGETVANAAQAFQGQQNSPLNDVGKAQAEIVAKGLIETKFDAIFSSDLDRAADTATAIAKEQGYAGEIMFDTRFREANFGEWEGHTYENVMKTWPDIAKAWLKDSYNTRPPGGETLDEVVRRVSEGLNEISEKYPQGMILVVCHGGTIRGAICFALGVSANIFSKISIDNCSVTVISLDDGRAKLKKLNFTF